MLLTVMGGADGHTARDSRRTDVGRRDGVEEAAIEAAQRFLLHNHRRRPLITANADGES